MKKTREICLNCGEYLVSFGGKYMHPESPCSGITDAIFITLDVEDENLQELFEDQYGKPVHSDYELLNKIYKNRFLKFLIERFIN